MKAGDKSKPVDDGKAARIRSALVESSGKKPPEPRAMQEPIAVGKGRKGKKSIAIYMTPLAKEVLDRIARKNKRSVQDLGIEALNLLFREYGEKPVA